MTFRTRLLVIISLTVAVAVAVVSIIVAARAESAFTRLEEQRRTALVGQFRREFSQRQGEVVRQVERLAASDAMQRIGMDPDTSAYVEEAGKLAAAQGLDLLEITMQDGTIISSAQWPARFGYKDEWVARQAASKAAGALLKREELQDDAVLALVAVRAVSFGDKKLLIAGGQKLDKEFLGSLVLPEGMRVSLARGDTSQKETARVIGLDTIQAIPLVSSENETLGVLLVASSRRDLAALQRQIRTLGVTVGASGVLLGLGLAWWATARVTRPVHQLAEAAGEVARGNWNAHVAIRSRDEIGELAEAFNQMTRQLIEQRERLVQAERVAAWRELARRLAHELKNPLFPLQITVENMQRARKQHPEQFEEVFREGSETLLAELASLKNIVARFSDFARMPQPERQPVDVNELVRGVVKLFEAQFDAAGVRAEQYFEERLPIVSADPEQFTRVLRNLVLNALDAMPSGGVLTLRTRSHHGSVRLEVSDTGTGLTKEECARLFTPYYTTKQHGTGLGLAIVQSVVSDHGGRISVESEVGRGTTFRIELQHGTTTDRG